MGHSVWRMQGVGTNIAVLADCHIHEDGPQFPSELLQRLQGADLIVTLGDMGEKAGLDRLQEIAPVLGVRGGDDADDMRTRRDVLVLSEGRYRIGCVFDAVASGLAVSSDPVRRLGQCGRDVAPPLRKSGRRAAACRHAQGG